MKVPSATSFCLVTLLCALAAGKSVTAFLGTARTTHGRAFFAPGVVTKHRLGSSSTQRTAPFFAEEKTTEDTPVASVKGPSSTRSLFRVLDEAGLALKPKALKAKDRVGMETDTFRKVRYTIQSSVLFSLFILYRGYRGFFVILPAVFSQVHEKLTSIMDVSPFTPEDGGIVAADDLNPKTGKVRKRTTITVSILAAIVTLTYVLKGASLVFMKFLRTITRTSSVPTSFQAAADEVMSNEDKMLRITKVNGSTL